MILEKRQQTLRINKIKNSLKFVHFLNLLLFLGNIFLNFLGNPLLKYLYLIHVLFLIICILIYDFDEILFEIMTLFLIEGQGRILWHYTPWSRIIFDVVTLFSVIKVFIKNKKFFNKELIPWPIIALLALHLFWFLLQMFNINSVSFFGALATSKIYIYPFILFLGISTSKLDSEDDSFRKFIIYFFVLLFAEHALNYYQFQEKQGLLIKISSYYYQAMKEGVFTDSLFRPFATTQLPGALAVFIFLTSGFLFYLKNNLSSQLFKIILIIISIFSITLCQIRSALVKYLLIIFLIQLGILFYKRFSLRSLIPIFAIVSFAIFFNNRENIKTKQFEDQNLQYAKDRISSLTEIKKLKGERLTISNFTKIIFEKFSKHPFGIGPGLTGPAASLSINKLSGNPLLKREDLWTSDNLMIALIIDLGIGSLFYLGILFFLPIYFLYYLLKIYAKKIETLYLHLLIPTATIIAILIGNWGALGITYNPESFIFWFMSALGLKTIRKFKYATSLSTRVSL